MEFSFTVTWVTIKWLGLLLLALSVVSFFYGSLPDNAGRRWADSLRWAVWPLFILWTIAMVIRGLVL